MSARSECTFVIMIMAHVSPMHIHVHMKAQKAKKMAYPQTRRYIDQACSGNYILHELYKISVSRGLN